MSFENVCVLKTFSNLYYFKTKIERIKNKIYLYSELSNYYKSYEKKSNFKTNCP